MVMFSSSPKREPSALQRQGADELHAMYTAYVDAGFSKDQALRIVLQTVASTIESQRPQFPG